MLVTPEKLEPVVLHIYHNSLLALHQGAWKIFLIMWENHYIHTLLVKTWMSKLVTYAKDQESRH